MKNKLLYLLTILTFCIGFSSAFLVSDQGTDVRDVSTGNLTALANLTISIYDSPTEGNLIFEQTFEGGIVNGSWNVMINPILPVLLDKVDSKYSLVVAVAKRARQIVDGQSVLVEANSIKPVSVAMQEILEGKILCLNCNKEK